MLCCLNWKAFGSLCAETNIGRWVSCCSFLPLSCNKLAPNVRGVGGSGVSELPGKEVCEFFVKIRYPQTLESF